MHQKRKYLYGIIKETKKQEFGPIGIGGQGDIVYTIPQGNLSAIVGNGPGLDFSMASDRKLAELAIAHQGVIEQVWKCYPILPIKVGTLAEDEEDVKTVLKNGQSALGKALEKIEDKAEYTIAALLNEKETCKYIAEEDEEIRLLKQEISKRPHAQTYQERVKIGKMVENALSERKQSYPKEILKDLSQSSVATLKKPVLEEENMILNAALLVEKKDEDKINKKFKELEERYAQRINFKFLGPIPPYSFSTIEIKRIGFQEIEEARKTLELPEEAYIFEIKQAYEKLSYRYDPEKNPESTKEKFNEITQAYNTLISYADYSIPCLFKKDKVEDSVMIKVLEMGGSFFIPHLLRKPRSLLRG